MSILAGQVADPPTAAELARLLAHDLRTPLNAVRGFADLLLAGAAGPVGATQAELLAEIARAGRALEMSIGLAQEVGEFQAAITADDAPVALEELLASCGLALAPTTQPTLLGVGIPGDVARWRRLLSVCHAHLQGQAEPVAQLAAALVMTPEGRLELIMERTDIHERWHMSVLREQLIRQLAAAMGVVLSSEVPHLPLKLLLSSRVDRDAASLRGP